MRDEEELIEEARRSVEETEQLREESGHGDDEPGPRKTSGGDAESVSDDES